MPNSNRTANEQTISDLETRLKRNASPGTREAIQKQHDKRKLTIPGRLDLLFDNGTPRFEIGAFAAEGVYPKQGEITSAGVRTVIGSVSGHDCIVIANDSMVKSGTWFPLTIEKILRAQAVGLENRLPLIYLVDSGGLFLPLQAESFPGRQHAGRIFFNNARLSAAGVPQIAAVMGPCVAGGAYIPALCDELLMVKGTGGIFLGGPYLVKAAIGEETDAETLGGASTHTRLSGMADYEDDTEEECLARVRRLAAQWPAPEQTPYATGVPQEPAESADKILDILPADRRTAYDTRAVLNCIVDGGSCEEYKAEYGQTLLTATARINGRTVGIVANQRLTVKSAEGEMQIGGVIYSDSADKAARFVLNCNQKLIPLLFVQDVTGFMVGTRAERGGIIKDGAKLVNAVSNSRVPKITLVIGNSYGAGNYALCGRAYDPRFMIAWPSARIAVMGGDQAANTILQVEKGKSKEALSPKREQELLAHIRNEYEATTTPYFAAANLLIDAIIDPLKTRQILDHLLRIACRHKPAESFSVGVFQV
jgi:acetyl-CoA carboxylase carboxyltransferase component